MATVSGRVVFDRNRSATIDAGDSGIENIPVILQDTTTNVGLVVLTNANGEYEFTNVPAGNYRIVESYGNTGGVSTPGDFDTAAAMPFAIGANPPIDFVTNPPTGSTNLDSLTPNTLLVTITDSDLTNQNFLNGPVIYTPIQNLLDPCASVSDTNLINAANNGTFGFFSQGTPANTGAPVEPYPGVTPDFTYVLPDPTEYTPFDGEYTIQNIMNDAFSNEIGAWWRIADHTTGNETGRMMVVNGFEPGAVFFRDIVAVQPNTNYLFTAWILNLFRATGYPDPALGVRIIGEDGDILYSQTLGAQIPVNTNAPEWKEIGTVVNSGDNTNITVEFVSEGPAVIGNDYAVDDISLNEIDVPLFTPVKTINTPVANVGDTVTYTVTLENTCSSSLTDVFFTDIVPDGLEFLPGSVTINNSPDLTADPNNGFELPDIPEGDIATVTFNAIVTDIPTINPTPNQATITYSYTPVEGGIPAINTVDSNIALLEVMEQEEADISVIKSASQDPVAPGEELTYTIVVTNNGPNAAENVELIDDIPDSIINPEYSIDEGATFTPWEGTLDLGTLADGESQTILIRGIVSDIIPGTITNTATVTSTTTDPNPDNNTATVNINVENEPVADVSVTKIPNTFQVERGEILTYRIVIANNGPDAAENVTLTDDIPSTIIDPEYSIDEGATFTPWEGTLDLGTLPAYRTQAILIRGTISDTATGTITNTAVVATTTTDSNPNNNTYTVDVSFPPEADISVVKSASQDPVAPGEELTYTIVVTNNGPDTAQLITVLDEVNLISPEYSIDEGATFNQWRGGLDIETLAAGESQTILIRGRVLFRETGTISNTVSVSSITPPDPDLSNNTDTVIVQVEEADISVVKSASQDPVARGEVLTYTIVVTNNGPFDAENVVLTDNILDSIIDPEYSIDEGATFTPWEGTLDLGTLLAGDSQTILIRGIVSDEATGTITNTATVTSTTSDPNPDNNTSVVDVEVEPEADIAVVKIAGPNPIQRGELLTYTIVVTNDGPDAAENVVLTDNILDSIIDTEYSIDGGTTFTPWEGTLDLGTLLAGESQTILIRGTVSDTATGPIANTATVTSTTSDPNPDNNTSAVDVDIVPEADVSVVKSASPNPVQPEQILTYTIVVSNNGPDVAEDVVLIDNILSSIINPEFSVDGGTTFTPWTGSFDIGTFAAGEEETILIRGAVSETLAETITNTATVSLTTLDPNLDNNTSEVNVQISQGEADVSVVKSASPNPVQRGELLTYTIVVTNDGPDAARGVRLNESLPFSLLNPEFSLDNGASFQPLPPFYPISLGTIEAGGTRDVIVRATVSDEATGIITNVARATSTTPDPNINNNESAANVEVEAADISVVKSASPNPVEQGEELTYIIVVTNNGPNASEDVILTDDIPDSIIAPEYSIDGGLTFNPWTGSIDLGTLVDGESRVVLIRGAVSDTSTGTITNTATVTSTTLDTNLDNNTFTVDVDIEEEVQADISVEKSATPDTVSPGEELIYTILVTNNGPDNAENVVLTDNIPISIINPEFSIDEGGTFTPWTGSLDLGTLASGEARTVLIRGTVPDTAAGIITNTAVLQSTTPDPDLNNNVSTVNVGVEEEQADISVEKIPDRNTVEPGDELTYTLFLQNNGPNDAENVVLTDNIPLGIIDPEFSIDGGGTFTPWTGSLDLGTLLNGESRAILIRGTVSDTAAGTITNTAVLQSTTLDPDISNNVSTINTEVLEEPQAQADILVEKTASPDTVSPGEMLTYTILVTNNGPDNAENVILTDNIPPSIINPEFSIDGGVFTPWTGNLDLGTLLSGETRTVLITGIVSDEATGTLTNTATVISTTLDPDPNNNVSTVNTEVEEEPSEAQADISVAKMASPNPVEPGEELTYTVVVTNNGPDDAENVILTDNIPDSVINPEYSLNGGMTFTPWEGTLDLGTVESEELDIILIRGTVSDTATGCINNTAIVTSTTPDPNLVNNVSSICVEVNTAEEEADISVVKTANCKKACIGENLKFTITVTNAGPADAQNVTLIDNVENILKKAVFSLDDGVTWNLWTGRLAIGTLEAGSTRVILLKGIVKPSCSCKITNIVDVMSTTLDPNLNNNTSTVMVKIKKCC